jgi:endoribonuclease L-PSP, putative
VKRTVSTDDAPAAAGAYSQGTTNGDLVFTAGQIAATPEGEVLNDEPIEVQTRQSLENVQGVLQAEGLTMDDVLKVTVFLDGMDEWEGMNEVYQDFFPEDEPARSAIAVQGIAKDVKVEIEAVADASGD